MGKLKKESKAEVKKQARAEAKQAKAEAKKQAGIEATRAKAEAKKQARAASKRQAREEAQRSKASLRRSSAQDQTRKVTSITRRLHFSLIRRKLGIYVFSDLLLVLTACAAFVCGVEYSHFTTLRALTEVDRSLTVGTTGRHLWYTVTDKTGTMLFRKDVTLFIIALCAVAGSIIILQLLSLLLRYFGENRRIRKILSPINEIALRADQLSRLSFTEDKYQVLEDAIEHITPGEARTLSFQDDDLVGVEAAINNLLVRMRDTYRQQARFVNDASHELRTPIAVIQGYANMLDRWGKEDETILDESITAIRNEADHMNHLVDQLLFLARGDSGKTAVTLEEIDLCAMMQEVYEESFMIDEAHPYRYRPDVPSLPIKADQALLKQAVRILIDNAAKYTKAGDEIILACGYAPSGDTYIQVQDSGIGMEEADVQHMFERFYRSDEVRSYQGTGLGLSIAKWIVDKHGGHFEILSRTGLGTRIRIILPGQ